LIPERKRGNAVLKHREDTAHVVIVTGGSSGIGQCTAKALAAEGYHVYDFSRHDAKTAGIIHIQADVTDESTVQRAVAQVLKQEGRIDILVNCAGFGISGAVEFTELSEAKRQFDVNFFGMVNVTRAVLPSMRSAGRGRIINVSSVAAAAAIPFQTFYSASKAAVNSYTCALANEVRPYGVTVTAIQPGDIRTGFTGARMKLAQGDEAYGGRISLSVARMEQDERNGMSPETAAAYICRIAQKRRVKPLYALGFSYKCVCVLCKILPCAVLNRLIGMIYAK